MLWKPFGKQDPRRSLIVPNGNPLAHFALNAGTTATPPINTYRGRVSAVLAPYSCLNYRRAQELQNLEDDLMLSARRYLESGNISVDVRKQTINVTRLFKFFPCDFGSGHDHVRKQTSERLVILVF